MGRPKVISAKEAAELVSENTRLMVGGFLAVGIPQSCVILNLSKDKVG